MNNTVLDTLLNLPDLYHEQSEKAHSIGRHLNHLFNSRRGTVAHLPLYGLPDISEIYQNLPNSLDGFIESVRKTILHYEPRLSQVRVVPVPIKSQDCVIQIRITGVLMSGDTIHFETYFISGGIVKLFPMSSVA